MTLAQRKHDAASQPQGVASDPSISAWVTANAGSGKTKVLIDRVARLLLGRAEDRGREPDPSKILCLTYTRAAAATMQNQLFRRLGGWALLDDEALTRELQKLAPNRADAVDLKRARRLFAQALETPGGLKIQTIHAFCESLLRRFPMEAKLSPHFTLLDEVETAALMREASERTIVRALEGGNAALRDATERVIDKVQEAGLAPLIATLTAQRTLFDAPLEEINERIAAALDVGAEETLESALEAFDAALPIAEIRKLAWAFGEEGGVHETAVAPALFDTLDFGDAATRMAALRAALLTKKGTPRGPRGFPTKAVANAHAGAVETIGHLQERLLALDARQRAIQTAANSRSLARFAKALLSDVSVLKAARDALDFDDLIRNAATLLNRAGARDWVRYKLDGGVDHILVDEAQDTSAEQWSVIGAIAEEFFAGDGARDVHRTLFVVGDEKQSIYSFQGAAPDELARMRERFRALTDGIERPMQEPQLLHSFRSTPAVLDAVDQVFAAEAARDGLSAGDDPPKHLAWRENRPGRVEFWPPVAPGERAEPKPWWQPIDMPTPDAPHLTLAAAIAERIEGWIADGTELPSRGRPIRAGDILILVRRRNVFADAMIRALKDRCLPVAGEDRMLLSQQLAVKDLLALARFALLPDDDLTLATVLRSPIVGLSEQALFDLAHHRKGRLWRALVRRRAEPDFAAAHALLADMLASADILRPFEFYNRVLNRHGARSRLLGRLGVQAEDPIDELLAQALAFETVDIPTLQAFVERVAVAQFQVKREMEQGRDEIRVMTAHGAKGLEANIVFLPDTVALPPVQQTGLFAIRTKRGLAPIWSRPAAEDPEPVAENRAARRARELQEYRRLLYVGMTRARDWLIVCGYHGRSDPKPESWIRLVEQGFGDARPCETPLRDAEGAPVQGLAIESTGNQVDRDEDERIAREFADPPSNDLMARIKPEPTLLAPLSPSRLAEPDPTDPIPLPSEGEDVEEPISSAERGIRMHALLDRLASLPPEHRRDVGGRGPGEMDVGSLEVVLDVLDEPDFAWIFGAGTRAEVPLAGPVAALGGRAVSGFVDRLVVGAETVDVIDFKSGRPSDASDPPEAYLRQLAVYAAAIGEIYPGRTVHGHLLWIDAKRLDTIDPAVLEQALSRTREALGDG